LILLVSSCVSPFLPVSSLHFLFVTLGRFNRPALLPSFQQVPVAGAPNVFSCPPFPDAALLEFFPVVSSLPLPPLLWWPTGVHFPAAIFRGTPGVPWFCNRYFPQSFLFEPVFDFSPS